MLSSFRLMLPVRSTFTTCVSNTKALVFTRPFFTPKSAMAQRISTGWSPSSLTRAAPHTSIAASSIKKRLILPPSRYRPTLPSEEPSMPATESPRPASSISPLTSPIEASPSLIVGISFGRERSRTRRLAVAAIGSFCPSSLTVPAIRPPARPNSSGWSESTRIAGWVV